MCGPPSLSVEMEPRGLAMIEVLEVRCRYVFPASAYLQDMSACICEDKRKEGAAARGVSEKTYFYKWTDDRLSSLNFTPRSYMN
jgi:hypothetical protein